MRNNLLKQVKCLRLPENIPFGSSNLLRGDIGDQPNQPKRAVNLFVNSNMEFQTFKGVGGAFSELGGKALLSLPEDKRKEVAKALFEDKLKFFRCPMGSSDFALDAYSLDEVEDDFELKHFSLDRDKKYLFPYMNYCKEYCNDMKLHVSPWSPPWWLKDSKEYGNGGSIVEDEKYYKTYAEYIYKFIEGYKEAGFPISRYLIQNEPDVNPKYPSCITPYKQMADIIKHIHKVFDEKNCSTEIWAGTFRSLTGASSSEFLAENPGIEKYISGIGVQYTIMQPLYDIQRNYPTLGLMHTESNCFHGENSWEQAIVLFLNIVDYVQAGCDAYTYWNMILNEEATSTWGWKQNSLININENTNDITFNPDFYVMELAAKCITPGSKRIIYHSLNKKGLAVKKPTGEIGFLVSNFSDKDEEGKVTVDGKVYDIKLPAVSISYFEI